jgi:hypothetical protein
MSRGDATLKMDACLGPAYAAAGTIIRTDRKSNTLEIKTGLRSEQRGPFEANPIARHLSPFKV